MIIHWLVILWSLISGSSGTIHPFSQCLLQNQLMHWEKGRCYPPFERGPCQEGEVLVLSKNGSGVCKPPLHCSSPQESVLDLDQGLVCECPGESVRVGGQCHHLFSRKPCPPGQLVMRRDDVITGTATCPKGFHCRGRDKCQAYKNTNDILESGISKDLKNLAYSHLKQLICSQKSKNICCPDNSQRSMLSPLQLYKSFTFSTEAKCRQNPCPDGTWPWQGDDGVLSCVEADPGVQGDCLFGLQFLEEEGQEGLLFCSDDLPETFSVIGGGRRRCRRGRIWSKHTERCVRLFRG